MADFTGFTPKQNEYIREAHSRWNFKTGATRSGKTFMDTLYTIPYNIRSRIGKDGLSVILGVTKSTIERNVLEPMRNFYTEALVGKISSDNTCNLFGERVYCLGAEKVSQQSKIRGASFKYVYGDEVAEWNTEVFELLKSRMDKSYSRFDGACNPKSPTHWLKKFIDDPKNKDTLYCQPYQIFDNPTLPPEFVKALCNEYAGTVNYQRNILGLWVAAEGGCYPVFSANTTRYIIDKPPPLMQTCIGVDFGGNKSATAFIATGFTPSFRDVVVLDCERLTGIITPTQLEERLENFILRIAKKYSKAINIYCDSAEQTLIAGIRQMVLRKGLPCRVNNALKTSINDRISLLNRLIGAERFKLLRHCEQVKTALIEAVYNPKSFEDERLDDGTTDIDTLDALEYTIEPVAKLLINNIYY